MTTEERMEIIKNKAKQIANAEKSAAAKEAMEHEELTVRIRELFDRIQDILALANACDTNKIKMPKDGRRYGYEYSFVAEGLHHRTGLIRCDGEYKYVGIENGGACGEFDFRTDGNQCYAVHESNQGIKRKARIYDMQKFLEDFPVFEEAFLKWIDNMGGAE